MEKRLTKEKALNLHRQMWIDMLLVLGNNPDGMAHSEFKRNWLLVNNYKNVECNCFLCEYNYQQQKIGKDWCEFCPIDWSFLSAEEYQKGKDASCGDRYIYGYESICGEPHQLIKF